MGLLRRRRDAQGLYRGDSPVSAPGFDGAAPAAYLPQPADSAPTIAPDTLEAALTATATDQPALTPTALTPTDRPAPPASGARRRRSVRGCLVSLIIASVLIGGVAFAVLKVANAVDQAVGSPGRERTPVEPTPVGAPVTVGIDAGTFEVTVFGASAQPGASWSAAFRGDTPQLIVESQLRRIDAGADAIRVPGWNWSVAEPGSSALDDAVTGDIITSFEPGLDGPELTGGQAVRGFLSFHTDLSTATLSLRDGPAGDTLAAWELSATRPQVVAGTVGTPAQGEISRPGFTVTVDHPRTVGTGNPDVYRRPTSGRYLLVELSVAPNAGVSSSLGLIERESFVFVTDDGADLVPESGAVSDALSLLSVSTDGPEHAVLAFDTAATAGTLQLLDRAGRVIITWRIRVR